MTLRLASFGLRGFVGESLTIRTVMDFASAFGTFVEGGRILLARDTRYSSPMLHAAVTSSLISCGCEVLDMGICPTPMLQFSVKPLGAAGGVSITGGHNGMGWNSITLIGPDGAFIEPVGGETVLDIFHAGDFLRRRSGEVGSVREIVNFADDYFTALAGHIDIDAIRKANLTVMIDPLVGSGSPYLKTFAHDFGFQLIAVNDQPSGYLPREAEPRPRSALQMASFIRHVNGQVGFVLNSDMSRMSMVTETGEPTSEEYTFAVIADYVLSRKPGVVVTNCCTTRTIDDIAARHKSRVVKTPVGQAYVISALEDESGVIGGEGSGGAMLPAFNRGFDGFLMMALVLEAMAVRKLPLSGLINSLPRYHIIKRSVACGSRRGYGALEQIKERLFEFGDVESFDMTDGLRVNWHDGWVHARASHTEQIVRVISESIQREKAEKNADMLVRMIGASV
jgi:phosphomannomutase